MKRLIPLAWMLATGLAFAQSETPITSLPAAGALGGSEQIPAVQNNTGVAITPLQLSTYTLGNLTGAQILGYFNGCAPSTPILRYDLTCQASGGGGSGISSISMTLPSWLSVSPATLTANGTFGITQIAPVPPANGGTGNANSGTINVGANNLSLTGGALQLTVPGTTTVSFPVAGTLTGGLAGLPTGTAKTSGYTGLLADDNTLIVMNCGSACTFTIPANASVAYPIGTGGGSCLTILAIGSGVVTVAITSDVLNFISASGGLTGSRTLTPPAMLQACKYASTSWFAGGVGVT